MVYYGVLMAVEFVAGVDVEFVVIVVDVELVIVDFEFVDPTSLMKVQQLEQLHYYLVIGKYL